MSANAGKRVSNKDLDLRIGELERKMTELADQVAKLDERIQRIANTITASQSGRF